MPKWLGRTTQIWQCRYRSLWCWFFLKELSIERIRTVSEKVEDLSTKLAALMPLEDLLGKTAKQIAFEGVASTIIHGRNKEVANSSATHMISTVKNLAATMNSRRKDRIAMGLWNMPEDPHTVNEILASSLQKLESMSIKGVKIQADMAEEDSPFDVSPSFIRDHPLALTIPLEDWLPPLEPSPIVVAAMIQLRDPLRRYEAVEGPILAMILAAGAEPTGMKLGKDYDERKYKVTSLHVGGPNDGGRQREEDREGQREAEADSNAVAGGVRYREAGEGSRGSEGEGPIVERIVEGYGRCVAEADEES